MGILLNVYRSLWGFLNPRNNRLNEPKHTMSVMSSSIWETNGVNMMHRTQMTRMLTTQITNMKNNSLINTSPLVPFVSYNTMVYYKYTPDTLSILPPLGGME